MMRRRSIPYAPIPHAEEAARTTPSQTGVPHEISELQELGTQSVFASPRPRPKRKLWQHVTTSWRRGAFFASISASVVLLFNLIILFYALGRQGGVRSIIPLATGSCKPLEDTNKVLHWLINGLSTLLLSCSNYCMQCVAAPTRQDVDRAHRKRSYLHIGVHSFLNLGSLGKKRLILWVLMAGSSLPLHLMYNSVVYSTLGTNDFYILPVTQTWLDAPFNHTGHSIATLIHAEAPSFDHLQVGACIDAYRADYLPERSTLILVGTVEDRPEEQDFYVVQTHIGPDRDWITKGVYIPYNSSDPDAYVSNTDTTAIVAYLHKHPDKWQYTLPDDTSFNIDHCLSKKAPGLCTLNLNTVILVVVIICNIIKLCCMQVLLFGTLGHPLVTVGDAAKSFMDQQDPHSKNLCLTTKQDIEVASAKMVMDLARHEKPWPIESPKRWNPYRERYIAAARGGYASFLSLIIIALVIVSIYLGMAINHLPSNSRTLSGLWTLGFGNAHANTIITGWSIEYMSNKTRQIVSAILVANTPQLILSMLYFSLNGICTAQSLAKEWNDFAHERKGLRVSMPREGSAQRKTHFLSLPWRYAIPLALASFVLHALVSQSIFFASVGSVDVQGVMYDPYTVVTCGFSPMAIIFVIFGAVWLTAIIVAIGFKRYRVGMPLVGSNSLGIAAACHLMGGEADFVIARGGLRTSDLAVQWGVVSEGPVQARGGNHSTESTDGAEVAHIEEEEEVGHCSFSARPINLPIEGKLYK